MNDILVVIVLYNCSLEESLTFRSIQAANAKSGAAIDLFVYDNSPTPHYQSPKFEIGATRITYYSDIANSGVSKAYNKGAAFAQELNKQWLLLFDQDSEISDDFFQVLTNAIQQYPDINLFAPILKQGDTILSPCRFFMMRGSSLPSVNSGLLFLRNKSVLNSGLCVRLAVYQELGGYNEAVYLDFSDHYFIEKFKQRKENIVVTTAIIKHHLSSHNDKKAQLIRFKYYCVGARNITTIKNVLPLFIQCSLRTIKLCFKYRTGYFLGDFFRFYIFPSRLAK